MKLGAPVLLLIVGVAIFANGYSVHPKYVQGWNSETAQKIGRAVSLGLFKRMEEKSKEGSESSIRSGKLVPILPPIPDPTDLKDQYYTFPRDSGYGQILYGSLSQCNTVMTGGSSITDDLSFSIEIPVKIQWKLDVGGLHLSGGHDLDLKLLGGAFNLTAFGAYTVDFEGFDLDLKIEATVYPTGSFDIDSADLNMVFDKLHLFGENAVLNGNPFEWEGFNSVIKEIFDAQWPTYKEQVDEAIKFTAAEMTKTCNLYEMAGGDYSCIGGKGLEKMIETELNGLLDQSLTPVCPTPPPPSPTPAPIEQFLLFSDNTTKWGDWPEKIDTCPQGTYAQGFQIKTENYQGPADDSSMNGIQLYCGASDSAPSVKSLVGKWGDWGSKYFCANGGFINGFQLKSEEKGHIDETATNNIRVYCSNNALVPIEADGARFGEWRQTYKCGSNYRVCGLMTQVQPEQGFFSDDTALNNLAFLCCLP